MKMNHREIAKTVCLLKSFFNDQTYPKLTHKIRSHIVFDFYTGQIMKHPKKI